MIDKHDESNTFIKRCVICHQTLQTSKEHVKGCEYCEDGFFRKLNNDGRELVKTIYN